MWCDELRGNDGHFLVRLTRQLLTLVRGKSGPGTAFVSPGGTSVFSLNLNLDAANVPVENVVFTDTLPKAISDPTLPAFDILNITSGTWSGGFTANVEYSTNDQTTWIPLGVVNGATNTTWTRGTHFTTPPFITDIRWVFNSRFAAGL